MGRLKQDITDAELSLLHLLWEQGPSTIRDLAEQMYQEVSRSEHATVQKLLNRLEEKNYITRDRTGTAHIFRAVVNRDDVIGHRLRTVAEKLCGGSVTPLLTHLMRNQSLSPEQRQELRNLIDEMDRSSQDS